MISLNPCTTRRKTKRARILAAFIEGRELTRFDAEQLGDHCLPSTVSALQAEGIRIDRKWIAMDGKHGHFRCCLYWLADLSDVTAMRIAEEFESEDSAHEVAA